MQLRWPFRRFETSDYWQLGVVLAAALFIIGVIHVWSLGTLEQPIVRVEHTYRRLVLTQDRVVEQSFKSKQPAYRGFIIYSTAPFLTDQVIEVTLEDSQGKVLARSRSPRVSYLSGDDTLVLRFTWAPVSVADGASLKVKVQLKSGVPIPLKVSSRQYDAYTSGRLDVNGAAVTRDLGLTALVPQPLSWPIRLGVMAGVITMLGAMGISLFASDRSQWIAAGILVVLITPAALGGFWFSLDTLGIADWDYYFSLHENYRQTIVSYHQFPFWNPWTCGGTAGLADPEFPGFTPRFVLELLFGVPVGLRLAIWVTVAATALGMLMLGKRLGLRPLPALLAAIGAAFSSVSLLEIVEGHVNVFAAMWIPWIFWAWLGAYRARVAAGQKPFTLFHWLAAPQVIWGGIFLALTFYAGGIYLLMYTALALLLLTILVPAHRAALTVSLSMVPWALGLAAFKLVPVLYWLREFPDESYASSTVTLPWLDEILLGRHLHGSYLLFAQDSGWHEYGAYVGLAVLVLALIGFVTGRRRRVVVSLGLACLAAILLSSSGPALKSIFDVMWFFPRSNISRFMLFAVLPLSLLAGFGVQAISYRRWFLVPVVLIGVVAVDLMSLTYQLSTQAFVLPDVYPLLSPAPAPIAFTTQRYDDSGEGSRDTRTYAATKAGYGTLAYCSVLGPEPAVGLISDEGETAYAGADDPQATVTLDSWSPNIVKVTVDSPTVTNIRLNTNYAAGWVVNGRQADEVGGRVGTQAMVGRHTYTFAYHPVGWRVGWILTAVTLGVLGWRVFGRKKPA